MATTAARRICLFGSSADPPTGLGGHAGIIRFLASRVRGRSIETAQEEDSSRAMFDEVWVLPVYRHTYSVRNFNCFLSMLLSF